MLLDTQQLRDALSPPVLRHQGREYVGRLFSITEWLLHQPLVDAIGDRALSLAEQRAAARQLLDAMFPPPMVTREHRGLFGQRRREQVRSAEPSVAELLEAEPFAVLLQVLAGFLNAQVRALGGPSADPSPSGGSSTPPTDTSPALGTASPTPASTMAPLTTSSSASSPTPTPSASTS